MECYTRDFYEIHKDGARRSAHEVIPLILSLLGPKSVIDVGCGAGTWLSVFHELGIEDFLGVDGHWVTKEMLEIPHARFRSFDLTKPLRLERQFDLVVSVEVAEHLPAECATMFVDSLIRLGPAVMFSAAIPHQGGNHHVNEQWPEYWAKLFEDQGYAVIDCIRSKIWRHPAVEWPYAQNLLLFARPDYIEARSRLKEELENTRLTQLSIVHPRKYIETIEWITRLHQVPHDVATLIPPENSFILIDDNQVQIAGPRALPFLERNGNYWGDPPDDATAINELERMRRGGADFLVFAWSAFWWFEYYRGFLSHVRSRFRCLFENDRIVVFDLRESLDAAHARAPGKSQIL